MQRRNRRIQMQPHTARTSADLISTVVINSHTPAKKRADNYQIPLRNKAR